MIICMLKGAINVNHLDILLMRVPHKKMSVVIAQITTKRLTVKLGTLAVLIVRKLDLHIRTQHSL